LVMHECMSSAQYELRYSCIKQTPSLGLRIAPRHYRQYRWVKRQRYALAASAVLRMLDRPGS
jgi:hypothetical protein